MEKSLSKEYREVAAEAKALVLTSVMTSASGSDAEEIATGVKILAMANRLVDLIGDMLEKHEELTAKMDKVMDKYLEK